MADNVQMSDASDKSVNSINDPFSPTEAQSTPIWDENNRLVDPELDAYYKDQAARATAPVEASVRAADDQALRDAQALHGQTSDVMTSPAPVFDMNTKPIVTIVEAPEPSSEPLHNAAPQPGIGVPNSDATKLFSVGNSPAAEDGTTE